MSLDFINFNEKIAYYCQSNSFKRYVRQAINDEIFWRDLLNNININNNIDNRLTSKLPDQVRHQLECMLPNMMEARYLNYIINRFPNQVSKEISNQLPVYLNNNYQMQQILDAHKISLKEKLELTVREILDKISNDPKYQEVVNSHLSAIDHNAEQKLDEITSNANTQLTNIQTFFDNQMKVMKKRVDENLSEFINLKKEVEQLKLEQKNDTKQLKWIIYGSIVCSSILTVIMTRRIK